MKVFIGLTEIANNIFEISETLKTHGIETYTACFELNRFYPANRYDKTISLPKIFNIPKIRRVYMLFYLFYLFVVYSIKFDVFVYVWKNTFLPLKLDLFLLRLFGTKVIVINCCDDVRYRKIALKVAAYKKAKYYATEHDYREYASNGQSFGGAFITQKLEELSGVAIMSTREQATFCKKPFFPYKFSTRRLLPRPKRPRDVPLIVHAPSDRIVKRTDIVLEAVEKLKTRNIPFRFELIENKPNEYVLQRLIDADIVIDQPATQPAKFAVEGLSASCVVFAGNDPVFLGLPEDPFSPVIQFYPDVQKLYEDLIPIVEDKGLRASLMRKSFEFWQDNYSREAFAKAFMRIIEGEQPTVSPWSDNKAMLLRFSDTWRQKMMISIFY